MLDPNLTITQQINDGTLHPALVAAYKAGLEGFAFSGGEVDWGHENAAWRQGKSDHKRRKLLNAHVEIAIKALELLDVECKLLLEGRLRLADGALLDRLAHLAGDVRSHALASKRAQS